MKTFKKSLFIFAIIVTLLLAGCKAANYTVNTALLVTSVGQLSTELDAISKSMAANLDTFSTGEQARLLILNQQLHTLRDTAQAIIDRHGDIKTVLIQADELKTLFTQGKLAYLEARFIIEPGLEQLPPALQADLRVFDRNAKQLSQSLATLLAIPGADVTMAISDVLLLGATAARLTRLAI